MEKAIKGLELCRDFFFEAAKPILEQYDPELVYSAGLIGYGSDVLGYDDAVSQDHMWGPRFYLFLSESDIAKKQEIMSCFSEKLPYQYKGYSVNFSEPDVLDNGVQHPEMICTGRVNPLIFIQTFQQFLRDELGTDDFAHLNPLDWLAFSEHRLLSIVRGTFFTDGLKLADRISCMYYYPESVRLYLIASNWDIIASEQAFMKRCGMCGDDIGSMLICARIAERLMRLCFLYQKTYAPYSKWFGTAFQQLEVDPELKDSIREALFSNSLESRENALVKAQTLVADLHNQSGITEVVNYRIESYYGRDIKVIFADRFAQKISEQLAGTEFEGVPLIGSMSQIGGWSAISDDFRYFRQIKSLYITHQEK